MRESILHILIAATVAGSVFFVNLGSARLWDRDEPRNAGCAVEMLERGDMVVPTFNDELRHQKPVLLYWLMMSAFSVFGISEFSARFWSALLGVGSVLATYAIGRRLFDGSVGLIAGLALASSLMFCVASRAATPDSVLIFCSMTALMFYVLGTFRREGGQMTTSHWFPADWRFVFAMYAMMGLGVLAKGPVGFILPMAIIGMFMLIMRRVQSSNEVRGFMGTLQSVWQTFNPAHFFRTLWAMKPISAALIILLIALPWYVMVGMQTEGEFLRKFFVGEHFGRATNSFENHSGGIWFYPLAILVGFFPWSVFWGPVAVGVIKERGNDETKNATTFLLCWVGVQVGVFTIAQTKLPSYVTPCYPALAVLTAYYLKRVATGESSVSVRWFYAAMAGLVLTGLCLAGGTWFATTRFMPGQQWLVVLGIIPVIFGIACCVLILKDRKQIVPGVFCCFAILFFGILFAFGTTSLDREQRGHNITSVIAGTENAIIGSYGCLESSWVYYGGKPIFELVDGGADRNDISSKKPWEPKPRPSLESFVSQQNAMLITTEERLESIKNRLPENFEVLETTEYFLKNKKLVLLGRADYHTAAVKQQSLRR